MATWQAPKTDWHGETDSEGNYTGDRFNAADFNRLKNNLVVLRDMAIDLYNIFYINDVGSDKKVGDYFYADEINKIEDNLKTINENTYRRSYGSKQTYYENGYTMNFTELNRLENAMLDLYDRLTNQTNGRRMFTWNFGMKGGEL